MQKFETICRDNYAKVFNYVLAMSGDWECAQDLTQEVFCIAYQKGKLFEKHIKPEAFLYTTAKNLIMAYNRKKKREFVVEAEKAMVSEEDDIFDQMCITHENNIPIECYKDEVLEHLSMKNRALYGSYYIKNLSMREIAKEMGVSEVAVRMKFVRLRKEIKSIVQQLKLGEF
ncbi:MAG: RNA polymerase sigma factor [Cellulosilyticaceae bacterium]